MDYPAYDPKSPITPLADDELSALEAQLQALPADGVMTLDGLDGYLTALVVGPPVLASVKTGDWLPAIWGGDPAPGTAAPFASNQRKKRMTVLVLRHLRSIAAALETDPQAWEPIFSVAEAPGEDGRELADAGDWCLGFLAATDVAPDAWSPLFDDAELGPGLATIALLAGEPVAGSAREPDAAPVAVPGSAPSDDEAPPVANDDLEDPEVRDHLSRAAVDAVLALWARRSVDAR
jgi:uncharacterized protein